MRRGNRVLWILAVGIASIVFALWPRGVEVIVTNAGTSVMRDVRVVVTGKTYELGELQPNARRNLRVNPTGESHLVVDYTDPSGTPQAVTVDCYFEPNYYGTIAVDVADGVVIRNAAAIRRTPW